MKKIQKVSYEMYYTTPKGRYDSVKELVENEDIAKCYAKSNSFYSIAKQKKYSFVKQVIIKGSEPLLPYKWHPKFTDYCVDIEGNVFRYAEERGYNHITPYIHTNPRMGNNHLGKHGYSTIQPFKDGKRYLQYHHRFVAETWIPNPENKPQVNHIDFDKSNNKVENLEWVTRKENVNHALDREGRKKAGSPKGQLYKNKYVYTLYYEGKKIASVNKLSDFDKFPLPKYACNYIYQHRPKGGKWFGYAIGREEIGDLK